MAITTCDLYDKYLEDLQVCTSPLISYGGVESCQGCIVTVRCYQDNSQIKELLTKSDGIGKVLVVDGGACVSHALMGDLIAESAVNNKWQGVIINGAIRDSGALQKLDLHIKALAKVPRKTDRQGQGIREIDLCFGDIRFISGHWLCSDGEGLITSSSPVNFN